MALVFAQRALCCTYDAALSVCEQERTTAVLLRLRARHETLQTELAPAAMDGRRERNDPAQDNGGSKPRERTSGTSSARAVDDLGALLTVAEGERLVLHRCQAALADELPRGAHAALLKLRALVHSNLRCLSRALVDRTWASEDTGDPGHRRGAA